MSYKTRKIRSFKLNDQYEAVYGGSASDTPGESHRLRVHGFALVSIDYGDGFGPQDVVMPFLFADTGFEMCEDCSNYLGVVPAGGELPGWMQDAVEQRHRMKNEVACME